MVSVLAPALARLSVQSYPYVDKMPLPDRMAFASELSVLTEREIEIPDIFTTLEDARSTFNQIFCFLSVLS
jgi:hypothetical protein